MVVLHLQEAVRQQLRAQHIKQLRLGDESNIAVWLLIAFTAASTVVIARKKKTEN